MIEDLFAPGRKHTAEEQKRLELSRVDVDGSDPGRGPIDLSSGKVTIRLAQAETPAQSGTKPPEQRRAEPETGAAETAGAAAPGSAPASAPGSGAEPATEG